MVFTTGPFLLACASFLCLGVSSLKLLKPVASNVAIKKLSKAANDFSLELYQNVIQGERTNVIISPFSVSLLLSAILVGARGKTAKELNQTLRYQKMSLEDVATAFHDVFIDEVAVGYDLRIYKALFFRERYKIDPNFGEIIGVLFMVEGHKVDFKNPSAVELVNTYIRNGTNRMIPGVFEAPLNPDTKFLLVSATHFRGVWRTKFNPSKTNHIPFFSSGGTGPKPVLMMNVVSTFQYTDDDELQAQILKIPYDQEEGDMIIVLPRSTEGLQILEREITTDLLEKALDSLTTALVNVTIPKFNITTSYDLKPFLQNMGVLRVFDEKRADLFGIVGMEGMCVSDVYQKNTIEVTEEGTVSSSAGIIRPRRAESFQIQFIADHPFLYFIQDRLSNIVFFIGHVIDI